ncbi:hypothetical protein GCM10009069_29340 [Algimonas arctica]|uniref:Uncharacterized protein n=1 Tax=Algimonas arctica TaxID=1479486 RepID=A0A8J3CV82_9PROT|nr:hypothetical protein GCM10009069_29340 [Algimonas arctica]
MFDGKYLIVSRSIMRLLQLKLANRGAILSGLITHPQNNAPLDKAERFWLLERRIEMLNVFVVHEAMIAR